MKTRFPIVAVLTVAGVLGLAVPHCAAAVDEADFNALKDLVIKQGQRIEQLEKGREQDKQTLEQTRKVHERSRGARVAATSRRQGPALRRTDR